MLWTLVAFIAILATLIVHFLKKGVKTITDNYFIYPSDAEIDQALPAEIMEHMMTFMDPLALIRCRLVSKYWRHHAIKPRLENDIMDAYERIMTSKVNGANESIWLNYPNYPKTLLLRDRALACMHGKQLLEINSRSFSILNKEFQGVRAEANKYIIKSLGTKMPFPRCSVRMNTLAHSVINFKEESVPGLNWDSIMPNSNIDIMVDAAYFIKRAKPGKGKQTVYSVRELDPKKYFGFVPLDRDFLLVLILIFTPLIVHDVLNSAFLSVVKTWLGPLSFLGMSFMYYILIGDFSRGKPAHSLKLFIRAALSLIMVDLLLTVLTIPSCTNYFAFLGMCALLLLYVVLLHKYTFPYSSKPNFIRAMPALTALVLIIAMNDWKLTVDSFRNGVIWWTLFRNTVSYALFCLHAILMNCLAHIGRFERWEWRYLVDWDRFIVRFVTWFYGFVVFITLYGPTWQGNHL